jgi:hypothetical protein
VLVGLIAGILAALIAAALLLLFVLSRRAARFPEELSIQYMEIPVVVRNGTVFRDDTDTAVPFSASVSDIDTYLGVTASRSLLTCSTGSTIRTTPRMFGLPAATFAWPEHEVIGSSDGFLAERGVWTSGNLPLGLSGSWVFGLQRADSVVPDTDEAGHDLSDAELYEVRGRVWLFLDTDPGRENRLQNTVVDVQSRLPGSHLYSVAEKHVPKSELPDINNDQELDDSLSGGTI